MTERATREFDIRVAGLEELAPLRELVGDAQFLELVAGIGSQVAETLRAQRDPETGEFPVVSVYPVGEDRLRVEIEGTESLHRFLERRLPELGFHLHSEPEDVPSSPIAAEPAPLLAFLAHAHEDHELALRIAGALHQHGIRCFIDAWELRAGDSIRQKLQQGLEQCTHFLVLLTPASLKRPWVQAEIDTGFIRMLGGKNRFVGIRHGVSPQDVGAFLETLWMPKLELETFEADMQAIAHEILGVTHRPPVAARPAYAKKTAPDLSPAAAAIARDLVERSEYALTWDPQVNEKIMAERLGLPRDDVRDAFDELKGLGCLLIQPVLNAPEGPPAGPTERLFVRYDRYWRPWDAAKDAMVVARLVADGADGNTQSLMESLHWEPRRMNPALAYLDERDLVLSSQSLSHPLKTHWIQANDATRRFLKQAS